MKKNNKINSIVIASHNQGKIKEMLPFVKKICNKKEVQLLETIVFNKPLFKSI